MIVGDLIKVNKTLVSFDKLAERVMKKYPEIRTTPKYRSMMGLILDMTQSCDYDEAVYNMKIFMSRGVTQDIKGRKTGDDALRLLGATGYIVAYDLYRNLTNKV